MRELGPLVVIVSDRDLTRHGLRAMLNGLDSGQASWPEVRLGFELEPDGWPEVVLVDVTAGSWAQGTALFDDLRNISPASLVLLVPTMAFQLDVQWARAAHAVLTLDATQDDIRRTVTGALRAAGRGRGRGRRSAIPAADPSTSAEVAARGVDLSPREVDVINAIASGSSNAEISQSLFLGINTVKTYIRTAYRKIGVQSRTQAVLWAIEHGFGDANPNAAPGLAPSPAAVRTRNILRPGESPR